MIDEDKKMTMEDLPKVLTLDMTRTLMKMILQKEELPEDLEQWHKTRHLA